ncbi:unnamed protein product [Schistosoma turkestanicum]|nr:unnamed protein product [Schistosoma turkestanicum]
MYSYQIIFPVYLFSTLIILNIEHSFCNSCNIQTNLELFHCSHQGLTTLPGLIHENTIELNLSYNLIEILHEDSFTRLVNIRKLILGHNRIYKITERAFLPIANTLIWLDLRFNQLTSNFHHPFPVTAFSQLVHVNYLDLSGNALNYLPARFLHGMSMSLHRLEMSFLSNKIYTEPNTFYGLSRLHHLNLAYNMFVHFMEDTLHGLRPEYFSYLNLEGVKWTCDCQIVWFRQWLNRLPKKAVYINSKPGGECSSPIQYKNMALMHLNLTSLQCQPELMHTIPSSHYNVNMNHTNPTITPIHVYGTQGENLTLVCSFISKPKMQIQWFYNGVLIQPHWSHVIQTVSPGINFTTTLYFKQLNKTTNEGYYQCQASNQIGQASAIFNVHVENSVVKHNPLQVNNKNLNVQFDYNSWLNPIVITIFIVLFNGTFIIIGLFIMKCIYSKRVSHQNNRRKLSNKGLTNNIKSQNVIDTKLIISNCTPNTTTTTPTITTNNNNSSNNQLITPIKCHSIDQNKTNQTCTDFIPISSKLYKGNLHNTIKEFDMIQQANDQSTHQNQYYDRVDLLKNNKTILQTKLINHSMKQDTPSPQSSDMGYLTLNASQNCESLIDFNANLNECNNNMVIKQLKPKIYYTLGVRSRNHSLELVYSLNNTQDKHSKCSMHHQDCSIISDSSLSPKQISYSPESSSFDQHSNKHQLDSETTNTLHDKLVDQNSCPIHGSTKVNEINSVPNQSTTDCPIHGSKSFINLNKSPL